MPLKKKDNKRELDGVIGFSVDIATVRSRGKALRRGFSSSSSSKKKKKKKKNKKKVEFFLLLSLLEGTSLVEKGEGKEKRPADDASSTRNHARIIGISWCNPFVRGCTGLDSNLKFRACPEYVES